MGTTSTTTQSSTTPQPTASDLQLQANEVGISNATNQGTINNDLQAQGLQSQIMAAGSNNINQLVGGVSTAQSMNEAALGAQTGATQAQAYGGLDSGSYQQAAANTAANTINSNAQFNISNLAQLLNLASGNSYQNVANTANNNSQANQLATSLTGSTSSGSSTSNPFLNSLYSSMGTGTGNAASTFMFG